MQIREKGGRYSFIRTVYKSDRVDEHGNKLPGRGVNEQIGSADVKTFAVDMREYETPEGERKVFAFTAKEREQWDQYCFDVKYEKLRQEKSDAITKAPASIASATAAIGHFKHGSPLNEQLAADIWAAMAELQVALKKAGFKRPKKDVQAEPESV
jgi:hypothetical protein